VLELEVLVGELLAVDGLSTGTVVTGEVSTLKHEVGDDTVEARLGVAETVLSGAELTEVALESNAISSCFGEKVKDD